MKMHVRVLAEGIVDFYNAIAKQLGYDSKKASYDCRRILVSKERFDAIDAKYKERYADKPLNYKEIFGMDWACFGPKTDEMLQGDEVIIEDGFIVEDVV